MDDKPNINCRCSFWKEYADTFIKQPDQTTFPADGTTFSGNQTTFPGDGTTSNQLSADRTAALMSTNELVGFWEILKNQPSCKLPAT